jgi:carbonic anhydrase/acetyltransferase-like protein (isoleucine patch superfamily)
MNGIYRLGEKRVTIEGECYVAPGASVIGAVTLKARSSIWFNCVVRGDNDDIVIGEETNIQDGSILHTDKGLPLVVGNGVSVGHNVVLHGCRVGDNSLIGIGSVVLNRARIGSHCLVGAGSLVTEGKEFPDRSVVMGSPARVVREVTDDDIEFLLWSASSYVKRGPMFLDRLEPDAPAPR